MAAAIYWISDGGGNDVGNVYKACLRWIRAHGSPRLIVIGGDVYEKGRDDEFALFFDQIDRNVSDLCETAGNHDWKTTSSSGATGKIPTEYEAFWSRFPPPQSRQPIDTTRRGAARYEHFLDIEGWRLVFVDTGPSTDDFSGRPWPVGDESRRTWLKNAIAGPGRAKIVFAHHSRVSVGRHGGIENVDPLWRELFDTAGKPLVALTVAGHDHNVTVYNPRDRDHPEGAPVDFAKGIHVVVNGAGGRGHDTDTSGTAARPDEFHDERNYCVTRIALIDARSADVETLGFGPGKNPPDNQDPTPLHTLKIRLPT